MAFIRGSHLALASKGAFRTPGASGAMRLRYITPTTSRLAGRDAVIVCAAAGTSGATVLVGATPATVLVQTDTRLDVTLPAKAAGFYDITVTNGAGMTDTLTNAILYLAIGTPILTLAEAEIKALVTAMSIASGYNFDWCAGANMEDMAQQATYPYAVVRAMPNEENLDQPNGADSGLYINRARMIIDVRIALQTEGTNPNEAMRAECYKALDDLKRLFGLYGSLVGVIDSILYQGCTIATEKPGDRFIPGMMSTEWELRYVQDRQNPSIAA